MSIKHIVTTILLTLCPLTNISAYDEMQAYYKLGIADSLYSTNDFIAAYNAYQDYLDILGNDNIEEYCGAAYHAGRCAMHIGAYDEALASFAVVSLLDLAFEDEVPESSILSKIMEARCKIGECYEATMEVASDIHTYKEQYKSLGESNTVINLFIEANDLLYEFEIARLFQQKAEMFAAYKKLRALLDDERLEEMDREDRCLLKLDCIKTAYYCEQHRTVLDLVGELQDDMNSLEMGFSDIYNSALFYRTCVYYNAGINEEEMTRYYLWNIQEKIEKCFPRLTNKMRKGIWSRYRHFLTDVLPSQAMKNSDLGGNAYDAILLVKGLLLHWNVKIEQCANDSGDEELMDIVQQIKKLEEEIAEENSLYMSSNMEIRRESLERRAISHMTFENLFELTGTHDDVRLYLAEDDVAIEFVRYDVNNTILGKHEYKYLALVLGKQSNTVDVVALPAEEELSQYVDNPERTSEIWDLLSPYIGNAERIFFSPDGILNILPLESFNPGHKVYRLTSTRELCSDSKPATTRKKVLLVGGLNYDAVDDGNGHQHNGAARPADKASGLRAAANVLEYLPETLTEIREIEEILQGNKNTMHSVSTLIGIGGDEKRFKEISQEDNNVIHIATHGFHLSMKDGHDKLQDMGIHNNTLVSSEESEAMLYSGIFLSGANLVLEGEKPHAGQENNVLTALEASSLNLKNCEMLVLSACETAKGEYNSEGVFGLQRGFKLAGVNSILMSLWKVDDAATRKLMTEFYSNWIGKKMTKHEALETAKDAVRNDGEHPEWQDPKYWAAFILLDGLD